MRISRRSSLSALGLLLLAPTGAAIAQDGAKQAIEGSGQASMERLEQALAKGTEMSKTPAPRLPNLEGAREERRAFEALRHRRVMPDMDARAQTAEAEAKTGLASEREHQAKLLRQALGLEALDVQTIAGATPKAPNQPKNWVPVLFASSSIPLATLRSYAAQLERVHGIIAFRGMPGGLHRVGPMAKLSAERLRGCPRSP